MHRPNRTDLALALGLLAFYELEAWTTNVTGSRPVFGVLGLALALPLLVRRSLPLPAVAVMSSAFAAITIAGHGDLPPQSSLLGILAAAHTAGAHAAGRPSVLGIVLVCAGIVIGEADDIVVLGPLSVATWAVGRALAGRGADADAARERADELERRREADARAAVLEERTRIARELHDVVAHGISTMVVQAGAERLALGDARPGTSDVLAGIEHTGREALGEMRRLVGLLRSEDEALALAPQPTLARLDALAETMDRAGLAVELQVEGDVAGLPAGLDVSAYRIVQEALTNALRHAGPAARASVVVRASAELLEIEVADDGRGGATDHADAGHGLVGMRERVALYGGELTAGPSPTGGFVLRTRLPLGAA